jgi:hypothetical protein
LKTFLPGLAWNYLHPDLSFEDSYEMTGTGHCSQLLVEMGSWELFAGAASNGDPPNRSLSSSWDYDVSHRALAHPNRFQVYSSVRLLLKSVSNLTYNK